MQNSINEIVARAVHFILVVAALLLSFSSSSFSAVADGLTPAEREIFDSTNRERALAHLAPLKWDATLASAARAHTDLMVREGHISHQFSEEPDLTARAIQSGVRFSKIAENVGEAPSLFEIHVGWMHSPGHRANILDSNLDSIGIGVGERDGQFYATQDFSHAIQTLTFEEQERRFGQLLQAIGLKLERDPSEARKACETGHADSNVTHNVYEFHLLTADLSSLPKKLEDAIHRGVFHFAAVGACSGGEQTRSGMYRLSVLIY